MIHKDARDEAGLKLECLRIAAGVASVRHASMQTASVNAVPYDLVAEAKKLYDWIDGTTPVSAPTQKAA